MKKIYKFWLGFVLSFSTVVVILCLINVFKSDIIIDQNKKQLTNKDIKFTKNKWWNNIFIFKKELNKKEIKKLSKRINDVNGITRVIEFNKYSIGFEICELFDIKEIQSKIENIYFDFIEERKRTQLFLHKIKMFTDLGFAVEWRTDYSFKVAYKLKKSYLSISSYYNNNYNIIFERIIEKEHPLLGESFYKQIQNKTDILEILSRYNFLKENELKIKVSE